MLKIKLFDDILNFQQSKEILLKIIDSKIEFLNLQLLIKAERFILNDSDIVIRLKELKNDREKVISYFENKSPDYEYVLDADIRIEKEAIPDKQIAV